jgi:hypothetical protein
MNSRKLWPLIVAGTICLAGVAQAGTVTMQLIAPTGACSPAQPCLGGVYSSPYTALIGAANDTTDSSGHIINATPTLVICDDFETDVSVSTTPWQATVTNVASISGLGSASKVLKFDQGGSALTQQQDYAAAAYLAIELLQARQQGNSTKQTDLSWALWGLFDQAPNGPLSGIWIGDPDLTNAKNYLSDALTHAGSSSQYSNVNIYTPNPQSASQEYIVVSAPEAGAVLVLAVDLFILLSVVVIFRKRSVYATK